MKSLVSGIETNQSSALYDLGERLGFSWALARVDESEGDEQALVDNGHRQSYEGTEIGLVEGQVSVDQVGGSLGGASFKPNLPKISDREAGNEQHDSEDPEHEDHDTTSPVMDPIENNEATSPAQSIDAEETEEAKTEVGENTSGLLIPEAQHLEPHRAKFLAAVLRVVLAAVLGWLISSGNIPVSEEQLVQAGFTPITPVDDAGQLYLRHHHNQSGSGAVTAVSGPYTRQEAEEEIRDELARIFD
ncbi:hypothetical protein HDK64DRAFT_257576 [Phyllosticta capitalensis]